jgi:hypothetical protein
MMAERFTRMDIGEMNFDDAGAGSLDRIVKSNGCMRKSTGIKNNRLTGTARILDPGHEFPFMVCLTKVQFYFASLTYCSEMGFYIGQCIAAVDLRLARSEQIEIGSIEDVDGFEHCFLLDRKIEDDPLPQAVAIPSFSLQGRDTGFYQHGGP